MSTDLPAPSAGGLAVASLSQAKRHKRRFDAVLTIEDPHCVRKLQLRFTAPPKPPHLVLRFEDVDHEDMGIQVATLDEVGQALAFGRAHAPGSLLVHCFKGVGRSAGVALAILADRMGAGFEREALDRLLTIRPEATPNRVVIRLADAALERGGGLIAALDAWEARTPGAKVMRAVRRAFVVENRHLYAEAS
jgi:predicted protein tyrosine phosphatase